MSEKAQMILEKVSAMPEPVQDKFLDRLDGAVMAVEALTASGSAGKGGDNGSDGLKPD